MSVTGHLTRTSEIRGPWIHTDEGKISEIQYHVGVQGEDSVLLLFVGVNRSCPFGKLHMQLRSRRVTFGVGQRRTMAGCQLMTPPLTKPVPAHWTTIDNVAQGKKAPGPAGWTGGCSRADSFQGRASTTGREPCPGLRPVRGRPEARPPTALGPGELETDTRVRTPVTTLHPGMGVRTSGFHCMAGGANASDACSN